MEITDKPQMCWFSAEMLVAYQFCRQGYVVGVPLSPCQYDLLIDTGQKVWKIQVKRARFEEQRMRKFGKGDRAHWELMLTKKRKRLRKTGATGHQRIADDEFDFLAVVCQENLIYIIPKDRLISKEAGLLVRTFHIKAPLTEGRADSIKAGERWEPFKNKFELV